MPFINKMTMAGTDLFRLLPAIFVAYIIKRIFSHTSIGVASNVERMQPLGRDFTKIIA